MKALKDEFFEECSNKPFCTVLRKWFKGKEYTEVEIAKALSSMVTHSLIELQKKGDKRYRALEIPFQTQVIAMLVGGDISVNEVKELYRTKFEKWVRSDEGKESEDRS